MNIPCKFRPLGNGGLPPGYMRVAYLQPAVSTASFDSGFYGTPDLGCRARGFLDTSRVSLFPTGWFLFISDQLYWTSLCYYLSKNAIGYRDNNKVLYPQQDELPDVEGGNNVTKGCPLSGNFQLQYNWLGEKKWTYMDADKTLERTLIGVGRESYSQKVYLLGRGPANVESWSGGVRDVLFSKDDRVVSHIVPVLNQQGQPAMWDLIRKQSLKKAGEGDFIVGMTLEQVRRLRLPAPTILNELTLSLPWEAEFDEQAQAALHAAADKGWLLTLQYAPIDLPEFAGYVRADYLETTGYQWLQVTDLHLGSTSDVNMKFAPTNMAKWFTLFYCLTHQYLNRMGSVQYTRKIRYDSINDGSVFSSSELIEGSIYHVRQWGERNFLNGIEQASNKASNFTINAPTLIGKSAHASTLSHMRIFWFKAAANINVYAIPAISSDGTPCMFDLVSKTPYYDAGTSGVPFTVGLTKAQAETLVLGEKASGLTIAVPADTDLTLVEANNPGITIIIQTN